MLFSSITFIFVFLPVVLGLYYLSPKKFRNAILLLASIVFYAWGEPKFLFVMFATILVNYAGTILICKYERYKKVFLTLTVITDLGFLCYFKYADFLLESFNAVFKTNADIIHVALPLGISFYTFQAISYTVDVYRGNIKPQENLYKLALYITLFPQLIAGPIVKYHDIAEQIDSRVETLDKFYEGLRLFILGLARKVLIANTLGVAVDKIIYEPVSGLTYIEAWLCVICFGFQIYNDFGGYADMAVGLCKMFGFEIKGNFNFPLLSKSYTEFWHRWHISLGTWVKEYIYIPLGGSRCSTVRHYFNLFIAFFIIGIWHGANMNMLMLGLYNAIVVILEKLTGWSNDVTGNFKKALHHLYMIPVLAVSYFFLRSPDFSYTISFLKKLFFIDSSAEAKYTIVYYLSGYEFIILTVAILGALSIFKNFLKVPFKNNPKTNICVDICLILLLILSISSIAASTYSPFIYFKF